MQYRLSTIFLVFFFVAATLALFQAWGIWIAVVVAFWALCLNKSWNVKEGIKYALLVVFIGIFCPWLLWPVQSVARESARRATCINHMLKIGLALRDYHDAHEHFPPISICDNQGKPLYSWLVEILPYMEYTNVYDKMQREEAWNSPHNKELLGGVRIDEFICPNGPRDETANYVAVVGSGTIWRHGGSVSIRELPNEGVNSVVAIEYIASGKHWAEPQALTAEEILERMETEDGRMKISGHPSIINVLFADGRVESLRKDMPFSLWQKLMAGKIEKDELDRWGTAANPKSMFPNHVSTSKYFQNIGSWPFLFSILVWVISLIMLFYRAWNSRPIARKQETSAG